MSTQPIGGFLSLLASGGAGLAQLSADPSTTATAGGLFASGKFGDDIFLHLTDVTDTKWVNLTALLTPAADADPYTPYVVLGEGVDPTSVPTDAATGTVAIASNGSAAYIKLSAGPTNDWLSLGGLRGRFQPLDSSLTLIANRIPARMLCYVCSFTVDFTYFIGNAADGGIAANALTSAITGVFLPEGAQPMFARASVSIPFESSTSEGEMAFSVGSAGHANDAWVKEFDVGEASATTLGNVGPSGSEDATAQALTPTVTLTLPEGGFIASLTQGKVNIQVFYT